MFTLAHSSESTGSFSPRSRSEKHALREDSEFIPVYIQVRPTCWRRNFKKEQHHPLHSKHNSRNKVCGKWSSNNWIKIKHH